MQRRRIHEGVTEYLLQDIRSGLHAVGEELSSERALMAEFGVGRPAVRESLAKLARMGLIDIRPGLRARVRPGTVAPLLKEMDAAVKMSLATNEDQRHMQELRLIFESAIARTVAPRATAGQLAVLRRIHEAMRAATASIERFANLDAAFLQRHWRDKRQPAGYGGLRCLLRLAAGTAPCQPAPARKNGKNLAAHGAVLAALEQKDSDAAEKAVRAGGSVGRTA